MQRMRRTAQDLGLPFEPSDCLYNTRLAQELLTSWLIEKFDDSSNRLKVETKKEAQDLRQQLVKVSAEFERVEFRLASLENLQSRLDDPHIARQIDDLVYAVKQLARER